MLLLLFAYRFKKLTAPTEIPDSSLSCSPGLFFFRSLSRIIPAKALITMPVSTMINPAMINIPHSEHGHPDAPENAKNCRNGQHFKAGFPQYGDQTGKCNKGKEDVKYNHSQQGIHRPGILLCTFFHVVHGKHKPAEHDGPQDDNCQTQ